MYARVLDPFYSNRPEPVLFSRPERTNGKRSMIPISLCFNWFFNFFESKCAYFGSEEDGGGILIIERNQDGGCRVQFNRGQTLGNVPDVVQAEVAMTFSATMHSVELPAFVTIKQYKTTSISCSILAKSVLGLIK